MSSLDEGWPFVSSQLPHGGRTALEIGCGPSGGFVPKLRASGFEAVGVDPEAPEGDWYLRERFETYQPPQPVDVVVASVSLHHIGVRVTTLARKLREVLTPDGTLIVLEWTWETFDEGTARWCFARLGPSDPEPTWLHEHQTRSRGSGMTWDHYMRWWGAEESMHPATSILAALDRSFDQISLDRVPYFFPDLEDTSSSDEQQAIDSGEIQATGIRYVGRPIGSVS